MLGIGLQRILGRSAAAPAAPPSMFSMVMPTLASTAINSMQTRSYRPHTPPMLSFKNTGRSVPVRGLSASFAYFQLKEILNESKVRETVRFNEWHERKHDKKRRKRKQADWRKYLEFVKEQVVLAKDLDKRSRIQYANYKHL
ncbi:hypothetical protein CcCBS67573_g03208 [Chytriomyces confervae]|uniref:Uncharacterized protein n=1 Tax=Chytriomyces confervae TaxID=246404 RepID=A0A507FGP2_9FUNG|nr:hypothetical protein CcCBS67573_g03208 [Chytriomyces confervae]